MKQLLPQYEFRWERLSPDTDFDNLSADIVAVYGYGQPDGFWLDEQGIFKISWCSLTRVKASILVVDACYSGMVQMCPRRQDIVISSTTPLTPSVNTIFNGLNITTMTYMFMCKLFDEIDCPFQGCNKENFDPQLCQMSIIMEKFRNERGVDAVIHAFSTHKDLHPYLGMGTVMINAEPWRKW